MAPAPKIRWPLARKLCLANLHRVFEGMVLLLRATGQGLSTKFCTSQICSEVLKVWLDPLR